MKIFNLCCNSPGEGGGGGGQQQKITLWFKILLAICPVGKMFTGYEKYKFSLNPKPLSNLKILTNFVSFSLFSIFFIILKKVRGFCVRPWSDTYISECVSLSETELFNSDFRPQYLST